MSEAETTVSILALPNIATVSPKETVCDVPVSPFNVKDELANLALVTEASTN